MKRLLQTPLVTLEDVGNEFRNLRQYSNRGNVVAREYLTTPNFTQTWQSCVMVTCQRTKQLLREGMKERGTNIEALLKDAVTYSKDIIPALTQFAFRDVELRTLLFGLGERIDALHNADKAKSTIKDENGNDVPSTKHWDLKRVYLELELLKYYVDANFLDVEGPGKIDEVSDRFERLAHDNWNRFPGKGAVVGEAIVMHLVNSHFLLKNVCRRGETMKMATTPRVATRQGLEAEMEQHFEKYFKLHANKKGDESDIAKLVKRLRVEENDEEIEIFGIRTLFPRHYLAMMNSNRMNRDWGLRRRSLRESSSSSSSSFSNSNHFKTPPKVSATAIEVHEVLREMQWDAANNDRDGKQRPFVIEGIDAECPRDRLDLKVEVTSTTATKKRSVIAIQVHGDTHYVFDLGGG